MDQPTSTPSIFTNGRKLKWALSLLPLVVIVASFIGGYGGRQRSEGALQQKVTDLEAQVMILQIQVERTRQAVESNRSIYATKQDVKDTIAPQTDMLQKILDNVKARK